MFGLRVRKALWVLVLPAVFPPPVPGQTLTLAEMRSLALRNHPAGLEAEALVRLGWAEISRARTWPDPSLRFSFGKGEPADAGTTGRETAWEASQEIPSPFAYRHRVRSAEFASVALQAEAAARRLDLLFQLEVLYFEHAAALERRRLAAENSADGEKIFELTSRRVELGEARETERLRAEVELLRQRRTLAAAEREVEVSRAALRRLVGTGLPEKFAVEAVWPDAGSRPNLESLQRKMHERNPEILAARAEAKRATEARKAAVWGIWPDLTAGLYADEEVDKEARGFTLGLRVPLWNANRPEIVRSRAEESLSEARLRRREIELASDLDRAYGELTLAAGQTEVFLQRLLPAARESLRLAQFAYEEGETSFLELLEAQRTYRETAAEWLAARRDAALAMAEIRRLSGGWSEAETD